MQNLLQRLIWLPVGACWLCVPAAAQLPGLVPLDDPEAAVPLVPPGLIRAQPELFGNYVHLWTLPDGTEVIQYYGDFTLHVGERTLRSRDAVIWMQKSVWNRTEYYHFQVFLSEESQVQDAAGTLTTAPMLFVTFNTLSPPVVEADVHTTESSAGTKLYEEAAKVRQEFQPPEPTLEPDDVWVQELAPPAPVRPRVRPIVRHRAREETIDEATGTITAIGDVYVSQGLVEAADFMEIRADAAVLFMARREAVARPPSPDAPGRPLELEPFPEEAPDIIPRERLGPVGVGEDVPAEITGVYLQGDVILTRGERMIRASELFYDFENDRALILDAVMRIIEPERNVPIYLRASQVRQLSSTEYFARRAMLSTSEFHTPHVHIGASRVFISDATPRDEAGRIIGLEAGRYRMYHTTFNVEGVPILYWPYAEGDFRRSETSMKSVRFAYSDDFGATFQSKWYLPSLLGLDRPQGVDAILRLDYFSERGPGVGIDVDYETENTYGLLRGYYIRDRGEDNLGPFRDGEPDTPDRGRLTLRHRHFLPRGWELTLEASYLSDPNFLEEYFNAEFEEGKEQETLIYLKKQEENWAFTALAQWRILDFLTQTEHLPDTAFHWIGEPLGEIASFYHESHLGLVRYRPDDRRVFRTGSRATFRSESRNEIDFPLKLGDLNVVPFAMARSGYWSRGPLENDANRMFGQVGVRTGTQHWRVFEDVQSNLFDVNGIRHIVRPEATAWLSATNQHSRELYPFTPGVEDIDDFYGTSLALRQQWQTRRGGPGRWRSTDWITFDVELNLFGDAPRYKDMPIGRFYDSRPENSIARNHVRSDFRYRISDTTVLLADANFDLNDGSVDLLNLSYAVERTPRFSYVAGYRRIGDTDSNLIGGGFNYDINVKHKLGVRTYYDLDRGEIEQLDIIIIRKFPRWYAGFVFGVDNIRDDIHVSVSLWPEGAPTAVLGSRRFTGLSESTGIRPVD